MNLFRREGRKGNVWIMKEVTGLIKKFCTRVRKI